jgi:cell division protein FtsB
MDNMMWIAVLVVGVGACYTLSDWIRARHGYPITDDNGKLIRKEADTHIAQLQAENDALKARLADMESRMQTMEKIATDPSRRLANEIERLS